MLRLILIVVNVYEKIGLKFDHPYGMAKLQTVHA